MNGTAFLRARTIDWVWHDFWCQVAIAMLLNYLSAPQLRRVGSNPMDWELP